MTPEDIAPRRSAFAARAVLGRFVPHWGLWLLVTGVFAVNLCWVALSPRFSLGASWVLGSLLILAGGVIGVIYRDRRAVVFDTWLDRLFRLGMVVLFAALMTRNLQVFNHLMMSLPMPMADRLLLSWDAALGFDWNAYARFAGAHEASRAFLIFAYNVLYGVGIGCILLLAIAMGKGERVDELAYLATVGGLACITLAAFFPAEAAWYTAATPETKALLGGEAAPGWLGQLMALRGGSPLALDSETLQGLSTFPSYHTCLGLIVAWCSRGSWLGAAGGSAAGLSVIAATPVFGGHYLSDLLGGAAVMAVLILLWQRLKPAPGAA